MSSGEREVLLKDNKRLAVVILAEKGMMEQRSIMIQYGKNDN